MIRRARVVRSAAAALAAALAVAPVLLAAPPAASAAPPKPPVDYEQTVQCVDQRAAPTPVANGVSWAQRQLRYTGAWQFTRGRGVDVAVIDTGVSPNPAFGSRLTGLADLVVRNDTRARQPGLRDCDGHGTLVAGLIAAAPDARSGFSGVAPDARILSIRQSSNNYADRSRQNAGRGGSVDSDTGSVAGTRDSLADAIDYAADRGVDVINVSEADCGPAGTLDEGRLRAAIARAVQRKIVVVVAAGNVAGSGTCSRQNTSGRAPVTEAVPADIDSPGMLTVGSVDRDGSPSSFSLTGPWVDVAAPGAEIISTMPYNQAGQVTRVVTADGSGPIQGTSFAAPYVAGVAALVKARFPDLSAAGIVRRIIATAAHPAADGGRNDQVGYGVVDPIAAVTADVPDAAPTPPRNPTALRAVPAGSHHDRGRATALWGTLVVVAAALAFAVAAATLGARRGRSASDSPMRS